MVSLSGGPPMREQRTGAPGRSWSPLCAVPLHAARQGVPDWPLGQAREQASPSQAEGRGRGLGLTPRLMDAASQASPSPPSPCRLQQREGGGSSKRGEVGGWAGQRRTAHVTQRMHAGSPQAAHAHWQAWPGSAGGLPVRITQHSAKQHGQRAQHARHAQRAHPSRP